MAFVRFFEPKVGWCVAALPGVMYTSGRLLDQFGCVITQGRTDGVCVVDDSIKSKSQKDSSKPVKTKQMYYRKSVS
jgi:hypothetical protein